MPFNVSVTCQGIGASYEITLYDDQGGVVSTITNTSGIGSFAITESGQYTAICEIDGVTSAECDATIIADEPQVPDLFIDKEWTNGFLNTQSGQVEFTIYYGNQ